MQVNKNSEFFFLFLKTKSFERLQQDLSNLSIFYSTLFVSFATARAHFQH